MKTTEQQDQEKEDLIAVLDSANGRRLVWRIMAEARVFHSTYTDDARQTAFREGKRNIGLLLLSEIMTHCPEEFHKMIGESND